MCFVCFVELTFLKNLLPKFKNQISHKNPELWLPLKSRKFWPHWSSSPHGNNQRGCVTIDWTVSEQVLCGLPQNSLLPKHPSHPAVLLALAPNSGHWSWHFGPVGKGQHPWPLIQVRWQQPGLRLSAPSREEVLSIDYCLVVWNQPFPGVSFLPFFELLIKVLILLLIPSLLYPHSTACHIPCSGWH